MSKPKQSVERLSEAMRSDMTRLLYTALPQVVSAALAVSCVAVAMVVAIGSRTATALAAATILSAIVRVEIFRLYRARGRIEAVRRRSHEFWITVYGAASVLLGIAYGAMLPLLFAGGTDGDRLLATGVAIAYTTGLSTRVAMFPWIGIATSWPIIGALALSFLSIHVSYSITGAALSAVYLASLTSTILQTGRHYVQQVQDNHEVNRMARFDGMTGLANRFTFNSRLKEAIDAFGDGQEAMAVLFVDLDRFKAVNDTHGHHVGDELLVAVARRLEECAGPRDVVSRFGGDEFAVLVPACEGEQSARNTANRVVRALSRTFEVDSRAIDVGASVGFSMFPADAKDPATLMRYADIALYKAKKDPVRRTYAFERSMHDKISERQAIEADLRKALDLGQLFLVYQPLVTMANMRIEGFEVLLRWKHPERGFIPPDVFIPVAEETGAILRIGQWVIETAVAEAATWNSDCKVAINMSPMQLQTPGFVRHVRKTLQRHGLPPERLDLEVTEGILIENTDMAQQVLSELRQEGICVSLDDFGTGFSSLSYLRRFPFDTIKVDKSFVQSMPEHQESEKIVRSIITLGHSLNLRCVAEGVETQQHVDMLRSLGCDILQGYLFSRPVPRADVAALIARHNDRDQDKQTA